MAQEEEIKYFVRISNTDLDGTKPVHIALTGIKGVGMHSAAVITQMAKVNGRELIGKLPEEDVDRIREVVDNYSEKVPTWMVNRPRDIYTGDKKHLFGTDVLTTLDEEIGRAHV